MTLEPEVIRIAGGVLLGALGGALGTVLAYGRRQARAEWDGGAIARRVEQLEHDRDEHTKDINGIGAKASAVQAEARAWFYAVNLKVNILASHTGFSFGPDRSIPPVNNS